MRIRWGERMKEVLFILIWNLIYMAALAAGALFAGSKLCDRLKESLHNLIRKLKNDIH